MIKTALDICIDAMRLAGYLSAKATPRQEDSDIAFMELQGLLDIWQTEPLMGISDGSFDLTLVSGQNDYAMTAVPGTNVLPPYIKSVVMPDNKVLRLTTVKEVNERGYREELPEVYTYSFVDSVTATLSIYGAPSGGTARIVYSACVPVPQTLNDTMDLPQGWWQMLRYCLADNLVIPLDIPASEAHTSIREKASSYKSRTKAPKTIAVPRPVIGFGVRALSGGR